MVKFKVGDEVVCIGQKDEGRCGCGWKLGKKFVIKTIAPYTPRRCCFPVGGGSGVYEDCLELVRIKNWKKIIEEQL